MICENDSGPAPGPEPLDALVVARPPGDLFSWPSQRDAQLRWCVVVDAQGAAEIRYFRSPQDAEGVTIRLTERECSALAQALVARGPHFLFRDDRRSESDAPGTGGARC